MRNFIHKLAKSEQKEAIELMRDVFNKNTKEEASASLQEVYEFLLKKNKEKVVHWLEARREYWRFIGRFRATKETSEKNEIN